MALCGCLPKAFAFFFPLESPSSPFGTMQLYARGPTLVSHLYYTLIGIMTMPVLYSHIENLKNKFMKNIKTVSGLWSVQ